MAIEYHILHLEDDKLDAELVALRLKKEGIKADIQLVSAYEAFDAALREAVAAGGPDLILADYNLPGYNGLAALGQAKQQAPDVPFIFVTGEMGEERAIETLKQGATDYVLKTRLSRLGPAVQRAVAEARERAARRNHERALQAAHAAAQHATERVERLLALSAGLARAATPAAVLEVTVQQGLAAAGAAAAAAFLRPEAALVLRTVFTLNYPEGSVVAELPLEVPAPITDAVRRGEAVWIESSEALAAGYPGLREIRTPTPYEAAAAVPLIGQRGARGALAFSFGERKTFGAEDRQLLTSIAQQCVQALERAELFTQAERLNRDLDARVRERTAELEAANNALAVEVGERQKAERKLEEWREAERARMALELHDELGSGLTVLKMDLAGAARCAGLPPGVKAGLVDSMRDIDGLIEMVRRISYELRPAALDQFGLLAALESHFAYFRSHSGLAGEFVAAVDELPVSSEAATALYRIFQEALTNVARHAQASRVDVSVEVVDGLTVLRVRDDGLGMPPEMIASGGRLGLVGMRERAQLFSGELKIESEGGHGTRLEVRIPISQDRAAGGTRLDE